MYTIKYRCLANDPEIDSKISYKFPWMINKNKAPDYVKGITKRKRYDRLHLNSDIYQVGYDHKLNKILKDTGFST